VAFSHCARLTPPQNPTTPSLPEPKPPDRQHFLGRLKRGAIAQRPESRLPTSQTTSGKHSTFFRLSQRGERKNPDVDEHSRMDEDDAACARLKSVGLPTSLCNTGAF